MAEPLVPEPDQKVDARTILLMPFLLMLIPLFILLFPLLLIGILGDSLPKREATLNDAIVPGRIASHDE